MRLIIPRLILQRIESKCDPPGDRDYFLPKDLVQPLHNFIDNNLEKLNKRLYNKYRHHSGTDERTLRYAWGSDGKENDGAIKELRDLLCYFGFQKEWRETLIYLKTDEEKVISDTNKCRENYLKETYKKYHDSTPEDVLLEISYDEVSIKILSDELQLLYKKDKIIEGKDKAYSGYIEHGKHPDILKHVFRFNMRMKDWTQNRLIIASMKDSDFKSERILNICNLTLYECEIRECYEAYRYNKEEFGRRIRDAKKYLVQVPPSYHNDIYFYWNGKWYLDLWWSTGQRGNLLYALKYFNLSLDKKYRWWVHCYKCIVLAILDIEKCKEESLKFRKAIIKLLETEPDQSSVKCFSITGIILADGILKLKKHIAKIQPSDTTDFSVTILHHIDLIYQNDPASHDICNAIINNWIA